MNHSRQDARRIDDARSWNEESIVRHDMDAIGAHGRQRRQRAPDGLLAGRRRGVPIRLVRLDDDLGRTREHGLGRHLKALPFHIGERILTAGRFDEVVQESHARADEDVAQRSGFPSEDERHTRPRPSRDRLADRVEAGV